MFKQKWIFILGLVATSQVWADCGPNGCGGVGTFRETLSGTQDFPFAQGEQDPSFHNGRVFNGPNGRRADDDIGVRPFDEDPQDEAADFLKQILIDLAEEKKGLPSAAELNSIDAFDAERVETLEALLEEIPRERRELERLGINALRSLQNQMEDLLDGYGFGRAALKDGTELDGPQIVKAQRALDVIEKVIENELEDLERERQAAQAAAEQAGEEGGGKGGGGPGSGGGSPSSAPPSSGGGAGGGISPAQAPQIATDPNAAKRNSEALAQMGQNLGGLMGLFANPSSTGIAGLAAFFTAASPAGPAVDTSNLMSNLAAIMPQIPAYTPSYTPQANNTNYTFYKPAASRSLIGMARAELPLQFRMPAMFRPRAER